MSQLALLNSTYRNSRQAAKSAKKLGRGWEFVRSTAVKTAWQVRRELRDFRSKEA